MFKISVIIPTYNRPLQTLSAINSVLAQTYKNYELIVVDDGSEKLLDTSILQKHNNCRVLLLDKNYGVSTARNEGIKASNGNWIAFLDSDDIWHCDKLRQQVLYLKQNLECQIVQTQEQWIRHGKKVNQPKKWHKKQGWIFELSLQRCTISPSSVLIQRSLLDEVGWFNPNYLACEDYDLWLRITLIRPVGLVNKILMTKYGGASDQLSTSVQKQDIFRIKALHNILTYDLNINQREAVLDCLNKKIEIVVNGFKKRGKLAEAENFYIDFHT